MPTREELPEFARSHQLGKLATRTEPVYTDDETLADEEKKHVASEGDYEADTELVEDAADAEVVLSVTRSGVFDSDDENKSWAELTKNVPLHRPIFDVDFPVSAIPSSTPGHFHLYIDKELTWPQYRRLLRTLADVGIIEEGYYKASEARAFTSVRMPSVKKPDSAANAPAVQRPTMTNEVEADTIGDWAGRGRAS